MSATILVIDDEKNIRRTLRMVLEGEGFLVDEAETGEAGLEKILNGSPDLVMLDIRLPGISGLDVLAKVRDEPALRNLPILMISGHASVAEAVSAVQSGATDFFEKPLDRDKVLVRVRNALQAWQLRREVDRLRADVELRYEMIGESVVMRDLFGQLEKVAPTHGRVLITGESGTGKELIARAIHRLSPRRNDAFIKVNCAAIPAELIESELFGYEKGAFTGAQSRRKGMFELADKGTLFLDEIGDMSASAQAKVLRALQNGEITRVGSETSIAVDVRVLAATNKDLEEEVREGRFREDLFFRLNVVPIVSPPLRDRPTDIPVMATKFLREFCSENGIGLKPVEEGVLEELSKRPWPGNVRQLKNVIERMAILSGERITHADLPELNKSSQSAKNSLPTTVGVDGETLSLREYREFAERSYILATLEETEWNVSQAAGKLGVERTNLHKKMRAYGIQRE
ncbi:MAG: two-component system nitrogen regulation response regulator NtrX [Polyangiales bacterium]|jgi:two-component system nitrogen regulation response regulator NtrX